MPLRLRGELCKSVFKFGMNVQQKVEYLFPSIEEDEIVKGERKYISVAVSDNIVEGAFEKLLHCNVLGFDLAGENSTWFGGQARNRGRASGGLSGYRGARRKVRSPT